jgi:hypothetical protein
MVSKVRSGNDPAAAKRVPRASANGDDRGDGRRRKATPLSPSLAEEIHEALRLFQGIRIVDAAAAELGWSRDTFYDRLKAPQTMTVGELLTLVARGTDPTFGQRLRHHIAAVEMYRAAFEKQAGDFYQRVSRPRDPRQPDLFGGDR